MYYDLFSLLIIYTWMFTKNNINQHVNGKQRLHQIVIFIQTITQPQANLKVNAPLPPLFSSLSQKIA